MRTGRVELRMKPIRCEPKMYIKRPNPPSATSNTGNSFCEPREREGVFRRALAIASVWLWPAKPAEDSAA